MYLSLVKYDASKQFEVQEHEDTSAYRIRSETGSWEGDCEPPPIVAEGIHEERATSIN